MSPLPPRAVWVLWFVRLQFPVDKTEVTYRTLWNAFKRIAATKQLSEADKREIFGGTAIRAYRIGQPKAAAL